MIVNIKPKKKFKKNHRRYIMQLFSADATIIYFIFDPENMKKLLIIDPIANLPKISPNLIFRPIKMVHRATFI